MDGLSAAASIIAVLDAAHEVVKICYDFRAALKSSPWALTRALDEITDLQVVLGKIEKLSVAGSSQQDGDLVLLCTARDGPLAQCADELKAFTRLLESPILRGESGSKRRALIQTLGWRVKDNEVTACLERIQRCKTTLLLALNADETALLLDIQTLTSTLSSTAGSIDSRLGGLVNSVNQQRFAQRRRAVLQWLCPINPAEAHEQAQRLRSPGTGQWLLESHEFEQWKSSASLLWITGSPGTGKTILFSNIVDHLLRDKSIITSTLPVYFYCDFRQKECKDIVHVLGSLLAQLCEMTASCPDELDTAFNEAYDAGKTTKPKLSVLRQAILHFARQQRVVLMIDAADECDEPGELAGLLRTLIDRQQNLQVLITSRDQVGLREALSGSSQIRLMDHRTDATIDIKRYIESRIQADRRLSQLKLGIQAEISQALFTKSDGMFRWVQCQLDTVSAVKTVKSIREALQSLPEGLDGTYRRILYSVPPRDCEIVSKVLRWVSFALSPLSLQEMEEAVAIDRAIREIDENNRLTSPDDVLVLCGSLVHVDELKKLKLAHLSVEDYLLSNTLRNDPKLSNFALTTTESNMALLLDCLAYLNFEEFATGPSPSKPALQQRFESYPLLKHAARSWPYYFRACESIDAAQSEVLKFFSESNKNAFLTWVQVLNANRLEQWDSWPRHATPLYYASSFGLHGTVAFLLKQSPDVNVSASRYGGTALHGATLREHVSVMRQLLDAGADPNKQDFNMISPLHTAVHWGNLDVIQTLLDYGASPIVPGHLGESALDWAAYSTEVGNLLLSKRKQYLTQESEESKAEKEELDDIMRSGVNSSVIVSASAFHTKDDTRDDSRPLDPQRHVDCNVLRGTQRDLAEAKLVHYTTNES